MRIRAQEGLRRATPRCQGRRDVEDGAAPSEQERETAREGAGRIDPELGRLVGIDGELLGHRQMDIGDAEPPATRRPHADDRRPAEKQDRMGERTPVHRERMVLASGQEEPATLPHMDVVTFAHLRAKPPHP